MDAILNHLKQHIIVSPTDIQSLQQTIREQYPNFTNHERAQLFAQALHRILNEALHPFEGAALNCLKQKLLEQTLLKDTFSINAFDIFHIYIQIEPLDDSSITSLTTWMNHYQPKALSPDEVLSLTAVFVLNPYASPPLTPLPSSEIKCITPSTLIKQNKKLLIISSLLVLIISFYFTRNAFLSHRLQSDTFSSIALAVTTFPSSVEENLPDNGLPTSLQYKTVNTAALKLWLESKQSLLAAEPYFTTIVSTAKDFNVNPLLLFAITGQEQNFVPLDHEHAQEIANNPFNLYGSWKVFNTSIEEAAPIAARTLINLGKDCPDNQDPIQWINHSYAEDPNWHLGVSYFLNELEEVAALSAPHKSNKNEG